MKRTPSKARRRDRRRARHLEVLGREAFMPLARMREIRWEESVIRSKLLRGGHALVWFRHVHFHCGTGCCLGTALPQGPTGRL